jgi:hypothetical protein
MATIETKCLKQKAVLWALSDYDRYGEPTVSAPIEISVRWEQNLSQSIDDNATPIAVNGTIFVDRVIPEGSILRLGNKVSLPPTVTTGLMEVVSTTDIPDLKGRVNQRTVTTRKWRGSLPTIE